MWSALLGYSGQLVKTIATRWPNCAEESPWWSRSFYQEITTGRGMRLWKMLSAHRFEDIHGYLTVQFYLAQLSVKDDSRALRGGRYAQGNVGS